MPRRWRIEIAARTSEQTSMAIIALATTAVESLAEAASCILPAIHCNLPAI
jgi:hypothetical protein